MRPAENERILAFDARQVDVGQNGDDSWKALADPDGNGFRILPPKRTLIT